MKFNIQNKEPGVSVCLITYNHAPYIRECIESLLMQETTFPYEICIGEDGSEDGTREICEELARRHPDRIRLFLRARSEPERADYLSQGVYNHIQTLYACRGKYLAFCDGDDAWIDPLKLQQQYDIMEANPKISLVHSDFDKLDEVSGHRVKQAYKRRSFRHRKDPDPVRFRFDVMYRNYPIAASTAFLRKADAVEIFEKNRAVFQACPMGDTITWCELIDYGDFHLLEKATALYRILSDSDSNSIDARRKFHFVNGAANFGLMRGEKYNLPMDQVRAYKVKTSNRLALLNGDFSEINRLHADAAYRFSFFENCIYHAGHRIPSRAVVRKLFEMRYHFNHRLLSQR